MLSKLFTADKLLLGKIFTMQTDLLGKIFNTNHCLVRLMGYSSNQIMLIQYNYRFKLLIVNTHSSVS